MSAEPVVKMMIQPMTLETAPKAVEMFNLHHMANEGVALESLDDDLAWWSSPGFELDRDTRLAFDVNGEISAYAELWDLFKNHVRMNGWTCSHPGSPIGRETRAALIRWMEERAEVSLALAPAELRVVLQVGAGSKDLEGHELLEEAGFRLIRQHWTMKINLDGKPPEPVIPAGLVIRPMVIGQEERAVIRAQQDAFKDHWGYVPEPFEDLFARWQHRIESDPNMDRKLWLVATDGDEIAGMSLCAPSTPEDAGMGWISSLGVRRAWRKRGLGLALLQQSFRIIAERGIKKAGLGVDSSSLTGATRLYEKAGMYVARRHDLFEKILREGIDLTTQTVE